MFIKINDNVVVNARYIIEVTMNQDGSCAWVKLDREENGRMKVYKISTEEFKRLTNELIKLKSI